MPGAPFARPFVSFICALALAPNWTPHPCPPPPYLNRAHQMPVACRRNLPPRTWHSSPSCAGADLFSPLLSLLQLKYAPFSKFTPVTSNLHNLTDASPCTFPLLREPKCHPVKLHYSYQVPNLKTGLLPLNTLIILWIFKL